MSEMVERVARALSDYGAPNFAFECYGPEYQDAKRQEARAAIAAMREPTAAMVDAVYTHRPELNCVRGHDLGGDEAAAVFTIMIDEALK